MKTLLSFIFVASLVTFYSCKKNCGYPQYLDRNTCLDIANKYTGDYKGTDSGATAIQSGIIFTVGTQPTNGPTAVQITRVATVLVLDQQAHFNIDSLTVTLNNGQPYIVNGQGYFMDTMKQQMFVVDMTYTDTLGVVTGRHVVAIR